MATWLIDSPQRLTLDGDVGELDVWFGHGKLRVVGTDGPTRIEAKKVGRRGVASAFPQVRGSVVPGTHAASGRIGSGSGPLRASAVSRASGGHTV